MNLRCSIIDDEPLALNVLADFVRQTEGLQLTDASTNPLQGIERVMAGETDLVFLDIQMPELDGIEFMKQAGDRCRIILTTAYPDYALDGYEYNVVDYLLKPISYERFLKAVQKVPPPVPDSNNNIRPDHFFVKSEYKLVRIAHADVLYLEALRDYVAIHLISGQKILTLQSMASFEKELPLHLFTRIHKSYMIAVSRIDRIEQNKVFIQTLSLPIGETYRNNLMRWVK
ncbi:MAG TPA: LytTR family DNA-binding domain-containing protein [Chitinophagaceae bacterium]|jgi:DNA-binding LytR/AlgR family response regulator|nr:LytTR family DNA-binding domain-containing protein [Chitinophagaceae bacterium]